MNKFEFKDIFGEKYKTKYHWYMGLNSNYPIIDIIWFIFVLPYLPEKYKYVYNNKEWRHRAFPLFKSFRKPKYYKCKKHDWTQYKKEKCNICKLEEKNE